MKKLLYFTAIFSSFTFLLSSNVQATVTTTGNVDPTDPTTWTNSTTASVGKTANGALLVDGGNTITSYTVDFGNEAGITGTATISGNGSTWNCLRTFMIGRAGNGILNITDGGTVNNHWHDYLSGNYLGCDAGATGTVNVSGHGSTWSNFMSAIGWSGYGELNITDGGTVNSAEESFIAIQTGSTGIATVSGAGSTWNNQDELTIGLYGDATLNITDGAAVNVNLHTKLTINGPEGTATIRFDNGTLTTGSLLAGSDQLTGTGTINTGSLIADGIDLVFDRNHGLQQSFTVSGPNKNLAFHLDCYQPTYMGAGYTGSGTLTIKDGLAISSQYGHIGYHTGSSGIATVSGTNSTWELASPNSAGCDLDVGYRGNGRLNITDGGTVTVQDETCVAYLDGSSGMIHFDQGTLNTGTLLAGSNQLTGTGTINTNGLIADGTDLVFDQEHGLQQTFILNGPNQNITVHLNQLPTETLGAGYTGHGTLTIRDGVVVESGTGYTSPSRLGYRTGSSGQATVTGPGSTWKIGHLYVGYSGNGDLTIDNGGSVFCSSFADIAVQAGSTGTITVSGHDSTWVTDDLYMGLQGNAKLSILDGATVRSGSMVQLTGASGSSATITISDPGSTWQIDSGFDLLVFGPRGEAIVNIKNGGLLKIDRDQLINFDEDNNNFINLSTGGMLALSGDVDDSIDDFLARITAPDVIRWWDASLNDWAMISTATRGVDYSLEYRTESPFSGYTVLTVYAVPEPTTVALLLTLLAAELAPAFRKRKR